MASRPPAMANRVGTGLHHPPRGHKSDWNKLGCVYDRTVLSKCPKLGGTPINLECQLVIILKEQKAKKSP